MHTEIARTFGDDNVSTSPQRRTRIGKSSSAHQAHEYRPVVCPDRSSPIRTRQKTTPYGSRSEHRQEDVERDRGFFIGREPHVWDVGLRLKARCGRNPMRRIQTLRKMDNAGMIRRVHKREIVLVVLFRARRFGTKLKFGGFSARYTRLAFKQNLIVSRLTAVRVTVRKGWR